MNNELIQKYLNQVAQNLQPSAEEGDRIVKSVSHINDKLTASFAENGLKEVRVFGSFGRGTLLTRKVANGSDIDVLIAFDSKKWVAQTYLTKLKNFAETHYPRSERYQDYPTISIELNHIKFELVPGYFREDSFIYSEAYFIPQKKNSSVEWIKTDPDEMKKRIEKFEDENRKQLISLILLFKYWNLNNQSAYKTYMVEDWVIRHFNPDRAIEHNFFKIIDELNLWNSAKVHNEVNRKVKNHRSKVKLLLENDMEDYALLETKKIIPEIPL